MRHVTTGVGLGVAGAAIWLTGVLIVRPIPPSPGPSLAVMVLAAGAAAFASRRRPLTAAVLAALTTAALIVATVFILAKYGPASLIPDMHPHAPTPARRLSDSRIELQDPYVGVAAVAVLLAAVLALGGYVTRRSERSGRSY